MAINLHANPGAFGGLPDPPKFESSRFAVLPIAYDGTSTWLKGADRGPAAMLEASANMELYDIETGLEPYTEGIVTLAPIGDPGSVDTMVEQVRSTTAELIMNGKTVVGLGGEHSISIGLIQAHAAAYHNLSVLQIDAHSDTRDEYEGSRNNHACVMARAAEVCPYVQVGIRSMDSSELKYLKPDRTFFAHEIAGSTDFVPDAVDQLTNNVYITIDLDAFDPSIVPSTGTPEPGGLTWHQVIALLREVTKKRNVVGFDVNELLPNPHNPAPDFLTAKLVYQTMALILANEQGK